MRMSTDCAQAEKILGHALVGDAPVTMLDQHAVTQTNTASKDKLIIERAADIAPEPIEWLWRRRMAIGRVTFITGQPDLAKSQAGIKIGATITTAGPWPCGEG